MWPHFNIYWKNSYWKTSFFVQWKLQEHQVFSSRVALYKLLNSYCKLEVQLCFLSPLRNWYLILQKKKKMMDFILEFIIICRELLIC